MPREDGTEDISLVPAFSNDRKVVSKMEAGTYLPCDVLDKRKSINQHGCQVRLGLF